MAGDLLPLKQNDGLERQKASTASRLCAAALLQRNKILLVHVSVKLLRRAACYYFRF
jgi:hypothetical protein